MLCKYSVLFLRTGGGEGSASTLSANLDWYCGLYVRWGFGGKRWNLFAIPESNPRRKIVRRACTFQRFSHGATMKYVILVWNWQCLKNLIIHAIRGAIRVQMSRLFPECVRCIRRSKLDIQNICYFCPGSCKAKNIRFAANERRMESAERADSRLPAVASGRQRGFFGHGHQTPQTVERLTTKASLPPPLPLTQRWPPPPSHDACSSHNFVAAFSLYYRISGFFFIFFLRIYKTEKQKSPQQRTRVRELISVVVLLF